MKIKVAFVILLVFCFGSVMSVYGVDWSDANVRGLYLNSVDVNNFDPVELVNGNITDVFVISNNFYIPNYDVNLPKAISKLNGTGIRIHVWIICFKNADGKFINPATNTTYPNQLIEEIGKIVSHYDIDGVQLDYVRYPIENPAYQYNGDKNITKFIHDVYDKIKSIKSNVALSAALVPEWFDVDPSIVNELNKEKNISKGENVTLLFGQNYVEMSPYLDFLMPMIYKGYPPTMGDYPFRNTKWVETTTKFAVDRVNKPVIPAILTYKTDDDPTMLAISELNEDIQATYEGGSKGFALFRYGVLNKSFFSVSNDDNMDIEEYRNDSDIVPDGVSDETGIPLLVLVVGLVCFGIVYGIKK